MRYIMTLLLFLYGGYASAHQWTPTYPKLESSYVPNVLKVSMRLFNNRKDTQFYELGVFDADMNSMKFATTERIVQVDYLGSKSIDIFIREQDRDKAVYVCSKSKLLKGSESKTMVVSRICSKIK